MYAECKENNERRRALVYAEAPCMSEDKVNNNNDDKHPCLFFSFGYRRSAQKYQEERSK
jgi:hypothetical protein